MLRKEEQEYDHLLSRNRKLNLSLNLTIWLNCQSDGSLGIGLNFGGLNSSNPDLFDDFSDNILERNFKTPL